MQESVTINEAFKLTINILEGVIPSSLRIDIKLEDSVVSRR